MNEMTVFLENLEDYLIKHDIKITSLAKMLNISPTAVRYWFYGNNMPKIEHVIKIVDLLNCSADYLFGLSDKREYIKSVKNGTFIERYDKLLTVNNLTDYQVAKICGIEQSTISKWRKNSTPKFDKILLLAKKLNCSLDYLVGISDY